MKIEPLAFFVWNLNCIFCNAIKVFALLSNKSWFEIITLGGVYLEVDTWNSNGIQKQKFVGCEKK